MSVGALVLSDARFPAGGHAHSGGVEPAAMAGTVTDLASLDVFLRGRLRTAGMVAAGLAAAACARARTAEEWTWAELDAEADARTPSPAQREASRRQGRALLRAARIAWPGADWLGDLAALGRSGAPWGEVMAACEHRGGPHHAVVLGAAAAAAGCAPGEAAHVAAYQSVAGPSSAAVRLLALDPMRAAGVVAAMAGAIAATAEQAARQAAGPLHELPFPSAPALDLLAEAHVTAEVRLFES